MKALEFLKVQRRRHIYMAKTMQVVYFDDELDEAIEELEELEDRTCESCRYLKITNSEWGDNGCSHQDIYDCYDDGSYVIPKDFCCNRYEAKVNNEAK